MNDEPPQDHDSLGSLTIPAASSLRSGTVYERRLRETLTPEGLAGQLARLGAVYGPPKDRSREDVLLMTREWFSALEIFGQAMVADAVSKWITKGKWWPSISEIREECERDRDDCKAILGLRDKPSYQAEPRSFCREGRTEAEEIVHRIAEVADIKKRLNYAPSQDGSLLPDREWVAASKDATVSDSVRNSCAARRARREPTCEPSCSRTVCAFKMATAEERAA